MIHYTFLADPKEMHSVIEAEARALSEKKINPKPPRSCRHMAFERSYLGIASPKWFSLGE